MHAENLMWEWKIPHEGFGFFFLERSMSRKSQASTYGSYLENPLEYSFLACGYIHMELRVTGKGLTWRSCCVGIRPKVLQCVCSSHPPVSTAALAVSLKLLISLSQSLRQGLSSQDLPIATLSQRDCNVCPLIPIPTNLACHLEPGPPAFSLMRATSN